MNAWLKDIRVIVRNDFGAPGVGRIGCDCFSQSHEAQALPALALDATIGPPAFSARTWAI